MTSTPSSNEQPRFGQLAMEYCQRRLPLQVLKSARGFYIGTASDDWPCSRESVEYWQQEKRAYDALKDGAWTQKSEP